MFGNNLQQLRKNLNLSQEELAEKLGVSRQAVTKWESGAANPDMDYLVRMSDLFRVSLDRLLKGGCEECGAGLAQVPGRISAEALAFLCRAKRSTYAAAMKDAAQSRPGSKDLRYAEGRFGYIDTYLGRERFSGEEGLWIDEEPVWAMNYSGRVLDDHFSDAFLREALSMPTPERPYRGPEIFQSGDYLYHTAVSGDAEWFQGQEEIYCGQLKVYELHFHGGIIV